MLGRPFTAMGFLTLPFKHAIECIPLRYTELSMWLKLVRARARARTGTWTAGKIQMVGL